MKSEKRIVEYGFEEMETFDDYVVSDTYHAQVQSALRAGWNEPAMDDYNNYDEKFASAHCQIRHESNSSSL